MSVPVPFYLAVTLAGVCYLVGEVITRRSALLQKYYIPDPIIGGFLGAFILFLPRLFGYQLSVPNSGAQSVSVNVLISLLTVNMGLHVTRKIFPVELPVFGIVWLSALVLYFVHLLLVFPVALLTGLPLKNAILFGPLSFTGAPYNTTPPNQVPPFLGNLYQPTYANVKDVSQGIMMIGVIVGSFLVGIVARRLFERAGQKPPRPSPSDRKSSGSMWGFAIDSTGILVLIFAIIAVSYGIQAGVFAIFPTFAQSSIAKSVVPVAVIGYLLGIVARLVYDAWFGKQHPFPKEQLTVLLLGPTMGFVLTYAIMSIPLYKLGLLTLPMVIAAFLAILGSVGVTWVMYSVVCRFIDPYYAAVVASAFLGITTGWGPIGMSYLRRFTDEKGPIPPTPIIVPLNAFFAIPWMVIGLSWFLITTFH